MFGFTNDQCTTLSVCEHNDIQRLFHVVKIGNIDFFKNWTPKYDIVEIRQYYQSLFDIPIERIARIVDVILGRRLEIKRIVWDGAYNKIMSKFLYVNVKTIPKPPILFHILRMRDDVEIVTFQRMIALLTCQISYTDVINHVFIVNLNDQARDTYFINKSVYLPYGMTKITISVFHTDHVEDVKDDISLEYLETSPQFHKIVHLISSK